MTVGDTAITKQLRGRKFSEQQRLAALKRRLTEIPERHAAAHNSISTMISTCERTLLEIEATLSGKTKGHEAILISKPVPASDQLRQRLTHLLTAITRHSPPSCQAAAATMRRAIRRELKTLANEQRGRP